VLTGQPDTTNSENALFRGTKPHFPRQADQHGHGNCHQEAKEYLRTRFCISEHSFTHFQFNKVFRLPSRLGGFVAQRLHMQHFVVGQNALDIQQANHALFGLADTQNEVGLAVG